MKSINKEDAMLIDVQYVKGNKREKVPDVLYIIWKELSTGEKHVKVIPEPSMEIHFEKPELRNHVYVKNHIKKEDTYSKTVKYRDIPFAIADDLGDQGKQILQQFYTTRNADYIKMLYTTPYTFGSDYDIRVWYRNQWYKHYHNDAKKVLTKGFLDIESDIMELEANGGNQDLCPIDLVTVIDATNNESYTFALVGVECVERDTKNMLPHKIDKEMERRRYYKNRLKQQNEVLSKDNPSQFLADKAHELFDESYPDMDYHFYFYKDERKLLTHLFQLINKLKLDFMGVWNIAYDAPRMINRMRELGLDPREIMCPKEFPVKQCYFKHDNFNFDVKNKGHFFFCSSYTVWWDQMVTYAALRKGGSELRSNRLTYIAQKELQDEKLDYSEIGSIKTLSYLDWIKYILYNIKDVLLQKGIEERTSDCESLYHKSLKNITPYDEAFKQTKMLRAVQLKSFESQGLIPGPNVNTMRSKTEEKEIEFDEDGNVIEEGADDGKFEGALVGDPTLIGKFGVPEFGKPSNHIFYYSIDMDMSAFYPSTIRAMNIDPSCLIFKCICDARQFNVRGGKLPYHGITDVQMNKANSDSFHDDIGKEIFDNFQTRNWLSTGAKWLNLPSVTEMYERLSGRLIS